MAKKRKVSDFAMMLRDKARAALRENDAAREGWGEDAVSAEAPAAETVLPDTATEPVEAASSSVAAATPVLQPDTSTQEAAPQAEHTSSGAGLLPAADSPHAASPAVADAGMPAGGETASDAGSSAANAAPAETSAAETVLPDAETEPMAAASSSAAGSPVMPQREDAPAAENAALPCPALPCAAGMTAEERLCLSLSGNACLLLAHLVRLQPRWINLSHTKLRTKQGKIMPYNTLCTVWKRLNAQGFIIDKAREDFGCSRGVRYVVSPALEAAFRRLHNITGGGGQGGIPQQLLDSLNAAAADGGEMPQTKTRRTGGAARRAAPVEKAAHGYGPAAQENISRSETWSIDRFAARSVSSCVQQDKTQANCRSDTPSSPQSDGMSASLADNRSAYRSDTWSVSQSLAPSPMPPAALPARASDAGADGMADTGADAAFLQKLYEHHPEYALWRAHGVPLSQLEGWRQQGMDVLVLDAGLRWFAWDCTRREAEGDQPDMAAEFAVWLGRGGFPRPEGYVSHEQAMLAQREAVQREREACAAREDALRRREALSALREECAAMLVRGAEDETYRSLRDSLPPFIRQQEQGALRAVFERAMWEALRGMAGLNAEDTADAPQA